MKRVPRLRDYESTDDKYKYFRVFGGFNSGTHALQALIIDNFKCKHLRGTRVGSLGKGHMWKHTMFWRHLKRKQDQRRVLNVIIVKDPIFWWNSSKVRWYGAANPRNVTDSLVLVPVNGNEGRHPTMEFRNTFECWNKYQDFYHSTQFFQRDSVIVTSDELLASTDLLADLKKLLVPVESDMPKIRSRTKRVGRTRAQAQAFYSHQSYLGILKGPRVLRVARRTLNKDHLQYYGFPSDWSNLEKEIQESGKDTNCPKQKNKQKQKQKNKQKQKQKPTQRLLVRLSSSIPS